MEMNEPNRKRKHPRAPFPFPLLGNGRDEGVLEQLYVDALVEGGVCEAPEPSRSVEVLSLGGRTIVRPIRRGSRTIEIDLA